MQRKQSTLSDRLDSVKLNLLNLISIALVAVLGLGFISYEAVTVWHFIRDHLAH